MSSKFKDLLANGQDEAVSVNQRALIDKVLARYSGEYTVYREMLQNSDDAGATQVEIRFDTEIGDNEVASQAQTSGQSHDLPNLKMQKVARTTVRNNGQIFREEDWNRLKKIAEVSSA